MKYLITKKPFEDYRTWVTFAVLNKGLKYCLFPRWGSIRFAFGKINQDKLIGGLEYYPKDANLVKEGYYNYKQEMEEFLR